MKRFLSFCLLLLLACVLFAGLPFYGRAGEADARAALALAAAARQRSARAPCGCSGAADCVCPPGTCACPQCAARRAAVQPLSYGAGYKAAVARGVPLLVWVGRPSVPQYATYWAGEFLQCAADAMEEVDSGDLLVSRPDGQGGMNRVGTLPGSPAPTLPQVRALLAGRPVLPVFNPQQIYYPPQAQFFAPRASFGGFGGGACRGGG